MTVIGALSSFRKRGEMSPHKRACVDWCGKLPEAASPAIPERPKQVEGAARLLRETRFIENGFVARVRAVGVVYWSAFTSITACL